MPYITCKDGHTYSRYSSDPYVKQCIADEKKYYRELREKCNRDPECARKRETEKNQMFSLIIGSVILLCYLLNRAFKNIES